MKYIIDTANQNEINHAKKLGINSITANPSMYHKNDILLSSFVKENYSDDLDFISFEPKEQDIELMKTRILSFRETYPNIIPKINFSTKGLELVNFCQQNQIPCAVTLIFSLEQALAAINAGATYLFVFIGRNEAIGLNGMQIIKDIQTMIKDQNYSCYVVAASIKTIDHLKECALHGIPFAAIPYNLYIQSLDNQLTTQGYEDFIMCNDYLD